MKRKKFNSGFSLMEVMIIMMIVMIVAVNLAKLSKDQMVNQYRRNANDDMNAVINEIGTILADPDKCLAFAGTTALDPNNAVPQQHSITSPAPQVPTLLSVDGKFTAPPQKFNEIIYSDAIPKYGNNRVAIHSFQIGAWSNPLPAGSPGTAVLVVNFFRKTS
jgi:type II secretory pathway pseudopilin PulG